MVEMRRTKSDVMVEALELGHKSIQPLIDLQYQMQAEVGKPKRGGRSGPSRSGAEKEGL